MDYEPASDCFLLWRLMARRRRRCPAVAPTLTPLDDGLVILASSRWICCQSGNATASRPNGLHIDDRSRGLIASVFRRGTRVNKSLVVCGHSAPPKSIG